MAGLVPAIHAFFAASRKDVDATRTRACPSSALLESASRVNPTSGYKPGHDDGGLPHHHFFSLRLPLAYSLSSQITHLPSCETYFVISGTMFWPWSSNVTGPTMES